MILLTAFEPFDETGMNSSQAALTEFLLRQRNRLPVDGIILPVAYNSDFRSLLPQIDRLQPSAILLTGQSTHSAIAVELKAVNLKLITLRSEPGNPSSHTYPIIPSAPQSYETTVPASHLVSAIKDAGVPAFTSDDAGTYACNHIFFRSLHHTHTRALNIPVGFLHFPRLPEQAIAIMGNETRVPSMSLDLLVWALEAAVTTVLTQSS